MEDTIIIAETERLILRRYKRDDIQDLFEYLSDEEVVKYEPYKPHTLDEAKEALEWRIGTDEMIAVELKNSHKMIQVISMSAYYWGHILHISYVRHLKMPDRSRLCSSRQHNRAPNNFD